MGRRIALLVTALCAVLAIAFIVSQGRPVPMADGPGGKVACVSYAPYNKHQTPFDETLVVPPEQIEEDMAVLSTFTRCVRTYSTGQGLDKVVEIAGRHGLTVYAGAWIGRTEADNQKELKRLVEVANAHPEALKGLVVGNEVLLRGEQTAETLARYIAQVKAGLTRPVPVTYADVWEFWTDHPELAQAVDFVTVHILPYWEDEPTSVEEAVGHVMAVWGEVRQQFAPKPILIGETGWPSEGRRRQDAEPTLVNQARYIRGILAAAHETGADYNLIEAFDQPWKRALEGTVGGAWGMFDAERGPKATLTGAVTERADAAWWLAGGIALGLLPLVVTLVRRERVTPAALGVIGFGGVFAGCVLVLQAWHALDASRWASEWAVNLGWLAFSLVLAGASVRLAAGLPCRVAAVDLRFLSTCAMAVASLGLLFNSRYRDMPVSMFLIPAVLLALAPAEEAGPEKRAVALLLAATSLGVLVNEGVLNTHAWLWTATALLLAAPSLVSGAFARASRTVPASA